MGRALDSYLAGTVATRLQQTVKHVGVRVWLPPEQRRFDELTEGVADPRAREHVFALDRVATVSPAPGQAEIERENLQQMVALTARLQGRC